LYFVNKGKNSEILDILGSSDKQVKCCSGYAQSGVHRTLLLVSIQKVIKVFIYLVQPSQTVLCIRIPMDPKLFASKDPDPELILYTIPDPDSNMENS
jgi:hypothetical protein